MYFDFGGVAGADVNGDFCRLGFKRVGNNESIGTFGKFCESENTVFIGLLVLVGFGNADISGCDRFSCALLIDGSLNITGLRKSGYGHGGERKQNYDEF